MATEETQNFNTDGQDAKTVKACADLGSVLSSSADGSQGVRSRRRAAVEESGHQEPRSVLRDQGWDCPPLLFPVTMCGCESQTVKKADGKQTHLQ